MKKKKPYKYNSKSRLTPNANSFPFKVNNMKNDAIKNLENTLTKFRIIEEPIEEKEELDNSFLEGRVPKKEKKEKKKITSNVSFLSFFRKLFLGLSFVCAIILVVLFVSNTVRNVFFPHVKKVLSLSQKTSSPTLDDNYLFVGGMHTNRFALKDYDLDFHYVNASEKKYTTKDLLENMKSSIYDYNPSIIFLEFGFDDYQEGIRGEEFFSNYRKIIEEIHENRPDAVIYIESFYPINTELKKFDEDLLKKKVTSNEILEVNQQLKRLAKEVDATYLDLYASLKKGKVLNPIYTDNGVTLNENGYQKIVNEIQKVVG